MDIFLLLVVPISVSLDSFFCGLSLSLSTKEDFKILTGIALSVFLLCLVGSYLGNYFGILLKTYQELLGGLILVIVALIDIKNNNSAQNFLIDKNYKTFYKSVIVGFAIGLDGAVGCLTLSLFNMSGILIPIYVTMLHLLFISIAIRISLTSIKNFIYKYNNLPYYVIFCLGYYKLLSLI